MFLLLGGVALRAGGTASSASPGLGRRMPLTSFGLVLGGLSPDRRAGHRRLRQQVVPDPGGAGAGPVVAGGPDRAVVAARGRLRLALRRSRATSATAARRRAAAREAPAVDARARAGCWSRRCVYFGLDTSLTVGSASRGCRARCSGVGAVMAPQPRSLVALAMPVVGAVLIAACRPRPNLREAVTLDHGRAAVRACVAALLPSVLAGERPRLTLLEMLPGPGAGASGRAARHAVRAGCLRAVDRELDLLDRLHARQPARRTRRASTSASRSRSPRPWASPSPATCSRCSCSTRR